MLLTGGFHFLEKFRLISNESKLAFYWLIYKRLRWSGEVLIYYCGQLILPNRYLR